uniref:Uncharacterized protein n=1 Tax=Cannabis sativa TaxID=3483 RepID=A0A803PIV7_CANSA
MYSSRNYGIPKGVYLYVVVLTDMDGDFDREVSDASSLVPVTVAEEYYGQDVDDHDAIGFSEVFEMSVDLVEFYALYTVKEYDKENGRYSGESRTVPSLSSQNKQKLWEIFAISQEDRWWKKLLNEKRFGFKISLEQSQGADRRKDPNKRCKVDLGSDDEEGTIIPINVCVHSNPSTIEGHVEALLSPLDERHLHELGHAASFDDLVSSIYRKKIEETDKELANEKEKSAGLYAQLDDIAFKAMCKAHLELFTNFKKGRSTTWKVDEELEVYRKIFPDLVTSGDEESNVSEFDTGVLEAEEDCN